MIANNWARMIAKAGTNQNTLSRKAGVSKPLMSMTCGGNYILSLDKLKKCCEELGCGIADIYDPDVILALYKEVVERKPKKQTPVRIRIATELSDELDLIVKDGVYVDKTEAVNAMIRTSCKEYRRIKDGSAK